jgi:hypothetical protein
MIPRRFRWQLPFWGICLSLLCAFPASAAVVSDDFDSGVLNQGLWEIAQGGGPELELRDQRLEIRVPATSAGEYFAAGINSRARFHGDLDIQVDFHLLDYPPTNGVRMGLVIHRDGTNTSSTQRTSLGPRELVDEPREAYLQDTLGALTQLSTSDRSGKLRLTRVGAVVTSSYWDAASSAWVPFASGAGTVEDVQIALSAWSHDLAFEDQDVRVAFDNFIVHQGELLAPGLPDLTGQWLELRHRRSLQIQGSRSSLRGQFVVNNTGGAAAGPFVVRFFLSNDRTLSPDDLLIEEQRVRGLRRRRWQLVGLNQALPRGVNARGRFVIAVIDADGAVGETNEWEQALARGPLR